jgi:catecholate siderophore receptor
LLFALELDLHLQPGSTPLPSSPTATPQPRRPPRLAPLVLALTAAAAGAQERGSSTDGIDRVDVLGERQNAYRVSETSTATKTATPLIDIPQSITMVTAELIRDQSMQNMGDVVRYVPGVQMAQGEGHRDAPILRGNASTADFFINGMRDDVQYYRDLYNVERVEVLKGPSGMIFGRGGTGGIINRVPRQADWTSSHGLGITFGSWDNRRLTADYGDAVNDSFAFRIAGLYEDSESYRDYGELTRKAVNPTLALRPGEKTTMTFGYERFEDDRITDRGVPSQLPLLGAPLDTDSSTFFGSPDLSPTWAEIDALSATVTHDFSHRIRLNNQTRLADYQKFYRNVFPGAYTVADDRVAISGYDNFTARDNVVNQTDVTFELGSGEVRHTLLAGAEIGEQTTDNFRQTAYFPAVGATATGDFVTLPNTIYTGPVEFRQAASDADNHSVAKNAALYLQDQIHISEHWQVVLGLRYDNFEVDLRNNRTGVTLDSSDDMIAPRAGLIYKLRDNMSLYLSHTLAFVPRAGEQLASLTATNRALDPEEFTNNEIGLKWDLGDRLATTVAVYSLDRTNVAITDPNNPTALILVDGQRVRGVELGLTGHVNDRWQLMAGYAYQDSELQTPGPTNGNVLGQVPEHSASFWNRYNVSPKLGLGLGVVYRSDVFVATDNAVTLDSFTRVDAAAFYSLNDNLLLQLNVENLFDEDYFASAHSNNNLMPGAPWGVRLGVSFRY